MKRWLRVGWLMGLVLLAALPVEGRAPPEWVKPYLADEAAWAPGTATAVQLVDSVEVRYLKVDSVRRTRRGAIRLVSERGRDQTEVEFNFNADTEKLIAAQAWVISPDGKSAEAFGADRFIDSALRVDGIFWPQDRVLSFDGDRVLIGGTLAWEIQVESQVGISDANWSFTADLPTAFSAMEVIPLAGDKIEWQATSPRIAPPVAGALPGALRWEMRELLPTVASERPDGFLPEMMIVSARGQSPQGGGRIQTWADMARLASEVIEPRILVTPELKAKAEALVAGKSGRWDRIRALTEFVQRDIAYLSVVLDKDYLAGYRPHFAAEVLHDRHGDCKDKATLLAAMLRAVGEHGEVILVVSGNPQVVRESWPCANFNHAISGIVADEAVPAGWPTIAAGALGRLVVFDPTDSLTPLGVLSGGDQGGFGLVASPQAKDLVRLPEADAGQNVHESRVTAALDVSGGLTAKVEETMRGGVAVALRGTRDRLRAEKFQQRIEARLHETMASVRDLRWTDQWESTAAQWRLNFDFKTEHYARRTGGTLMMVSPAVVVGNLRTMPWKTERDGVAWVAASTIRKQVRLALPEDIAIEEIPDDFQLTSAGASCALTYQREAGAVVYAFEFVEPGGFLNRADYEVRRAFIQKVQAAERRPLVVRQVAAAKAEAPARK